MGGPTIRVMGPREIHIYAVGCVEGFASMAVRIMWDACIEMIEFASI